MNIFEKKLDASQEPNLPIHPVELYQNCRFAEGYAYLRGIQEEVLNIWHNNRSQRDVICKMNTGSGKTLTGLLMLYSKMIELKEPVLFLCPDNQLVDQTVNQANLYGIPVCEVENSSPLPLDFLNSKKILVCTFSKLFNGRSVFNRNQIKLAAIVLDDAHKCVDIAREQSSLSLGREHQISKSLVNLFQESLKHQLPGSFQRLFDGDPSLSMKVPYWAWMDNHSKVIEIINTFVKTLNPSEKPNPEDGGIFFKWNLIADNLLTYDCYIGGENIEINPSHAPYHKIVSLFEADHRFILSATFEDDYDLLKDLGISYESILSPIIPKDRKDIGRRLILAPKRFDPTLSDSDLRMFISKYRDQKVNVVVLVPSTQRIAEWVEVGAKPIDKTNIEEALEQLASSQGEFMVFNNRYDGIDLNGSHCRVLVLDGLPMYGSVQEHYEETRLDIQKAGKKAQKIEQGLGRAVRSGSDFCVVYTMGTDLMSFLGLERNLNHFTPVTKAQLNLGLRLLDDQNTENSLAVIKETASYCLDQADGWLRYHAKEIAKIDLEKTDIKKNHLLELAENERKAFKLFGKRLYKEAADLILDEILNSELASTKKEKGWYYQMAAQLAFLGDKQLSNDLQAKANDISTGLFHPAHGHTYKRIFRKDITQASLVIRELSRFQRPQDISMYVQSLLDGLQYIPEIEAKKFENKLEELGKFLGFNSQQPEKQLGIGPDGLWCLPDGTFLILEAKSRAIHEEISRQNINQLLQSIEWFKQHYIETENYTAVTLQNSHKKGFNVTINPKMRVIDKNCLADLKANLVQFGNSLQSVSPSAHTVEKISNLLVLHSFTPGLFVHKYMKVIS